MDQIRDFEKFKRLVSRLCVTFDKFANDEIVESWWKALRNGNLAQIEARVDAFIARATEKTKFPRPGQFQSDDAPSLDPKDAERERRISEDNVANWAAFIAKHPKTGPIRRQLAQCSRIMAMERESSPAYAEALREFRSLETYLGPAGRFSADQ